jgi:predicted ATPase/DNA-binding SARP family transcriptional activator
MELRILGPLEVSTEDGPLRLGGAKQRALLALLALQANQVVSRERLIDALWGEDPPATAGAMVQVYVSRLRKLLPDGAIVTRRPGYLFEAEPGTIDLERFEQLVTEARAAGPARAAQSLRAALALWRGPPLAEFDESFARTEGGRLEQLRVAALEERIEADLALGRGAELVGELEGLIAEHPHRERLRVQLMLALYRANRQADALAAYREARSALDELGIEPGEELQRLELQILRQDEALRPARRTTNLPLEQTPLIGRTAELADVLELVRSNRLVTLTGAGGSGKTRLSLQAAHELLDEFTDGVWFVSLASLGDPGLLEPTIAQAIGARGELNDFLRGKQLLLVLDNLEQLLPGVAPFVSGLEAKVLATSRERLNVVAEHEYSVPTLPLDAAVALFTQRARQLKPRFEPDADTAELARRLDGLPLALELAAARVKVLTSAQIVERLDEGLDLLVGGGRDRPERHRTLRATLEWSYDLLGGNEQRLFARLGLFASSFDLLRAETVAEAAVDDLQSLVDKSLLAPAGGGRFAMLDTMRTFARERLEGPEIERLRRRQLELLAPTAGRAPLSTYSADDELAWLDHVEPWLPDIRELLAWALARDPANAGLMICRLEYGFLTRGGGEYEARAWLERLLEQRADLPDEVLGEALARLAHARRRSGELESAAALAAESVALFRRLGDRAMAAWASRSSVFTLYELGRYDEALALSEAALAMFRELENQVLVADALKLIGNILLHLGESDRAREALHEAVAIAESSGDYSSDILHSLGDVELEQRNLAEAETLYLRASAVARRFKYRYDFAYCLAGLASVAALRRDSESAGERWGRFERLEQEAGVLPGPDRERYERILEPISDDAAFRRGYAIGHSGVAG